MLRELHPRKLGSFAVETVRATFNRPRYKSDVFQEHEAYERLADLYKKLLLNLPDFPRSGTCIRASEEIQKLGLGFFYVGGYFRADIGAPFHSWCVNGDKTIVDFTCAQFNKYQFIWNKIPEGILILEPGNPLHQRYVPGNYEIL